jgi:hypothetical protein
MTTTTPSSDVETSVAEMNDRAQAITEAVEYALHAEPGSTSRDNFAIDALANLESLENVLDDLRAAVEALP